MGVVETPGGGNRNVETMVVGGGFRVAQGCDASGAYAPSPKEEEEEEPGMLCTCT
jgi:hypothetical protein